MRPVLIVGNIDYIRKEWTQLENLPQIFAFNGSVLCRDHLNAINLIVCNICVILSPNSPNEECDQLRDRLSILSNINVKAYTFDDSKLHLLALNLNESTKAEGKVFTTAFIFRINSN